jgi:catechol 2,3-dioxygenase-like lactoylglutathione lyase family enzyme
MDTAVFDHVGLAVGDLDAQRRFYGEALGLNEVEERLDMPEAGIRTVILRADGGLKIELIERAGSTVQEYVDAYDGAAVQGYFHWALHVDDLAETYAHLLAVGAISVSEPAPAMREGARFAYVKDPEGNLLELIQPGLTS